MRAKGRPKHQHRLDSALRWLDVKGITIDREDALRVYGKMVHYCMIEPCKPTGRQLLFKTQCFKFLDPSMWSKHGRATRNYDNQHLHGGW